MTIEANHPRVTEHHQDQPQHPTPPPLPKGALSHDEIVKRMTYQKPTPLATTLHEEVTRRCIEMAEFLNTLPPCREVSLAQTHLEEVRSWANAGIARNHDRLGDRGAE